jgi:hypothetical protein
MDPVYEPTETMARGLSRRNLLGRVGGGIAGAALASLGLGNGRRAHAQAQAGTISLRELMGRISREGCDSSRGIRTLLFRALLPRNPPVISIRDVAGRYAGKVNHCKPLQLVARNEQRAGGHRVHITGENFTPGDLADIRFESGAFRVSVVLRFSVRVLPDGTVAHVQDLGCEGEREKLYSVKAIDVATGRSAEGGSVSYTCPQAPPRQDEPITPPFIRVSPLQGFAFTNFTVTGSLFVPDKAVEIRVVDPRVLSSLRSYFTRSDALGGINHVIPIPCSASGELRFSASDGRTVPTTQDITGLLWSNTVPVTCPIAP